MTMEFASTDVLLRLACQSGNVGAIKIACAAGAINFSEGIAIASEVKQQTAVDYLLNVHVFTEACRIGNSEEMARLMREHGEDYWRNLGLGVACRWKQRAIMRALIESGANQCPNHPMPADLMCHKKECGMPWRTECVARCCASDCCALCWIIGICCACTMLAG